ncbi:MAG TPA: DNA-binding protein [Noviherbaspirillum sp.]
MARSGLYKSDVKKARDALIAQGKHPSVDAVRIALGNTGSKTTIHKYLKELEEEDGGAGGHRASISEALQDLVVRLAAQLQDEANARIDAARADHAEKERQYATAIAAARAETEQWRAQWQAADASLQQEQKAHSHTHEQLRLEQIARSTAEQHAVDLQDRLSDKEAHCRSLEDKHRHAYEALEHYRQSVKEQREQDQRRHEQQLQQVLAELRNAQQSIVVKQEDITRLNQEGARLVAELTHARHALQDEQKSSRQLTQRIEALQAAERRADVLQAQVQALQEQLTAAAAKVEGLAGQAREHELAAVAAHAKLAAQEGIVTELRGYLANRPAGSE